ncbi:MAG TPA: hypothetical protein VKE41_23765 [Roseiflexaceae bacterium]|nr:hypothetical protein [Roseiflexaceae bacterium]
MRAFYVKRSSVIAVALLALSMLPAWAIYAQGTTGAKTWSNFHRQSRPIAASTPASTPSKLVPAALTGPFLPIILTSIRVSPIVFSGSATSNCLGTTGTSFTYGIKYLCVDVIVDGAQGQAYRFRWTIDGQLKPNLGNSGTIGSQLVDVPDGICYGPSGGCGDAVPRGTYQVSFFLNDIQYQTATALIR